MKTDLVKIGVPSALAQSMKRLRTIRQVLDQTDAAVNRLQAAANQRIREITAGADDAAQVDTDAPVEAPTATM